jgi:transcriptional regulator with XRE-family HTH domain
MIIEPNCSTADTTPILTGDKSGGGCVATVISMGHRALFNHHIRQGSRSLEDLAAELGISRRQLGRILGGNTPLRLEAIVALSDLLGIDRQRALMAIGVLGDWQRYFDANLEVILQLVQPLLAKLDVQAEFAIEPLSAPAVDLFSNWLADALVANEEQIRRRRDTFTDLPELRRPIRRSAAGMG